MTQIARVQPGVGFFFGGEVVIGDDPLPFVQVRGFPVVSMTLRDTLADRTEVATLPVGHD